MMTDWESIVYMTESRIEITLLLSVFVSYFNFINCIAIFIVFCTRTGCKMACQYRLCRYHLMYTLNVFHLLNHVSYVQRMLCTGKVVWWIRRHWFNSLNHLRYLTGWILYYNCWLAYLASVLVNFGTYNSGGTI